MTTGFGAWVKRHWLFSAAVGALVTSTVGLLVNQFGPGIIEQVTGEPALRIVVSEDNDAYTMGHSFALPGGLPTGELPVVSGCQQIRTWVMRLGGVDAGRTHLNLSIEGRSSSPVLIKSMRARIVTRSEPLQDTVVRCLLEGEIGVIGIGFNLDEQPSLARTLLEDGTLGEPYFEAHNLTLAEGEVLPMSVTAFVEQCSCEWRIEIEAVVEGEEQTFMVDNSGEPFETTAIATLPSHKVVWYGDWASCSGLVTCFPGEPSLPITGDFLRSLRREGTVSVLPPV
jgi:hypothetical protein